MKHNVYRIDAGLSFSSARTQINRLSRGLEGGALQGAGRINGRLTKDAAPLVQDHGLSGRNSPQGVGEGDNEILVVAAVLVC